MAQGGEAGRAWRAGGVGQAEPGQAGGRVHPTAALAIGRASSPSLRAWPGDNSRPNASTLGGPRYPLPVPSLPTIPSLAFALEPSREGGDASQGQELLGIAPRRCRESRALARRAVLPRGGAL